MNAKRAASLALVIAATLVAGCSEPAAGVWVVNHDGAPHTILLRVTGDSGSTLFAGNLSVDAKGRVAIPIDGPTGLRLAFTIEHAGETYTGSVGRGSVSEWYAAVDVYAGGIGFSSSSA